MDRSAAGSSGESSMQRMRRRALSIPAVLGLTSVAVVGFPLISITLAAADVLRGRVRLPCLRSYLFVLQYLVNDSTEILAAPALWAAAGFGRRLDRPSSIRRHERLQAWSLRLLARRADQLLGLRLHLTPDSDSLTPGPVIVVSRHVSLVDASLPALLCHRSGMSVRGVVMTEMLADPGFDLIYQRTGSVFIPRDDGPVARARVEAMVRGADASTAYVIFPEGRLATPSARVRSLARLRETSPHRCDRLEVLDHLLPPRPGGVTSLLAALPTADVILLDHRGLERFPTVRGLLAAAPFDSTIDIHLRRIPRRDIPVDPTEQVVWLDQLWIELDASLGTPIVTATDDPYSVSMDQPGPARNPSGGEGNVVLTGFMGTGKSTVGRLLARRLGYEFVDTDEVIEQRHGPIPAIFAERGEAGFRALERTVAAELAEREGLVISTGGRMMLDAANVAALGRSGCVFCLVATAEEILQRVTADDGTIDRPLLAGDDPRQKVVELLAERAPGYARFDQIDTEGRSPGAIAAEIAELIRADRRRRPDSSG